MKTYIVIFSLFLSSSLVQAKPFSLGFIGDAGKTTQNAMTVRDSMIRGNELRLVMAGDNLYSSSYQNVWGEWFAISWLKLSRLVSAM